jgi:Zn-finger nucleic acid-binding protein
MATSACRPQTVFASATVEIQHCPDCQLIHLTMGSITMRMTEQHFSQFSQDLGKGFFEFSSAVSPQPTMRLLM